MRSLLNASPVTQIESVIDVLHGMEISDPYRWLEDQNSARTREWIDDQADYTRAYFESIPRRSIIRRRVETLLASKEVVSDAWNVGDYYFFRKPQHREEQPAIVVRKGLFGEDSVLVDPSNRDTAGHTAVSILSISDDARFMAYAVRCGGTDHSMLEILDLERQIVLPDRLPEGFLSGFAFAPHASGFFYSHRELHDAHPNYRAVFWHRFGTKQQQDEEVFIAGEQSNLFVGVLCSAEAALLLYPVHISGRDCQTSVYVQPLDRSSRPRLLLPGVEGLFAPFFVKGQLFAYTDYQAPNGRVVRIDIASPDRGNWHDVVSETDRRIQQFAVADNDVFVTRASQFMTNLETFDLANAQQKQTVASICGSVDLLTRTTASPMLFYSVTTLTQPASVYCYKSRSQTNITWNGAKTLLDLSHEVSLEQVVFRSRDNTEVPLLLASRKDQRDAGSRPTFLTGYGGFGSCVTPRFTAFAAFLIEQGFLFAVPALRGGAELGEQWHQAGKREHRQNSFDDFIAAAEWLIEHKRADPGRIAIGGGSNAGLLVGAAITQRPDLFRAAICLGPLLDMVRFHLFDFASGWSDEYGSPDDEQDCKYLLNYSPYHRVRNGIAYPAVLLISGDADTRCNPMHARKMTARLQAATTSDRPILLDYKTEWGHTPVQPLSARIEALTDRLAFICHELEVEVQNGRAS